MNSTRYNQIIDEVYENYKTEIIRQRESQKKAVERLRRQGKRLKVILIELLSKEDFINKCKTDNEFSEKWGLKIEERELSLEERYNLMPHIAGHSQENIDMRKKINNFEGNIPGISYHEEWLNSFKIPTKLITLTHNNETIESYE